MVLEGIYFVDRQNGWFLCLSEQVCHFGVELRHTLVHIHHQEHYIRLADRQIHLAVDLALEGVIAVDNPSSGINHTKLTSAPFGFAVLTVTRRAGGVHHYRPTSTRQAVKQGRFPDVGTTHYRYNICHSNF